MRPLTVAETIGLHLDSLHDRGLQESSVLTTACVLRSFFRPSLGEPLPALSPARVQELADALAGGLSAHTRRPLAQDTRRHYQHQARVFLAWCVRQNRLPASPLDPRVSDQSLAR